MSQIDPNEDWKKSAPQLASLKKKNFPEVPKGYFEEFPEKLMTRIRAGEGAASKGGSIISPALLWLGGGVAATIIISILVFRVPDSMHFDIEKQLITLSDQELFDAIETENISSEEILEIMGDEALSALVVDQSISDQELIDYIEEVPIEEWELDELNIDEIDLEKLTF